MGNGKQSDPPYSPRGEANEPTISVLDLIAVIAKRKWLIVGMTGLVALVTLGVLLASVSLPVTSRWNLLPNTYKPTAKILIQAGGQSSSLSSLLGGQSGLGALSGLLGGSLSTTNADLVTRLLKTNSILDKVAEEFDLVGLGTNPKTDARKKITGGLSTAYDAPSGIMDISFLSVDREFATKVVNRLVELVKQKFNELTVARIMDQRQSLQKQLISAQERANQLQTQGIAFQEKHSFIDIPAQTSANINTIASLSSQIVTKRIDLEARLKYFPETDPGIVRLRDEIAATEKAIVSITQGSEDLRSGGTSQKQLNLLSVQFAALQRDLTVQLAIVSTLQQQYEAAKLEETNRTQAFQVLEGAEVPEVKFGPSRPKIGIVATLIAFLLGVVAAFVVEYIARAKADPIEGVKLQQIRDSFIIRRRPRRE